MDRLGGRADGLGNPFQRLMVHAVFGVLVAFYAIGMVPPVVAQSPGSGPITTTAEKVRFGRALDGRLLPMADVRAQWDRQFARMADASGNPSGSVRINGTSYHRVPVAPYSPSTVAGLAKNILKKGPQAAAAYYTAKGIIDAAGWAIDELSGQVQTPGTEPQPLGQVAYCTQMPSGQYRCADQPGLLLRSVEQTLSTYTTYRLPCVVGTVNSSGAFYGCTRISDSAVVYGWGDSRFTRPGNGWPSNYSGESTPATNIPDGDIAAAFEGNPEAMSAIAHDPSNGAPYMTPELAEAMNNLMNELAAEHGGTPTVHVAGQAYEEQSPSASSEWPRFCHWAAVVCEFFDWVKEDTTEEMELPMQDVEIQTDSWSSGIGGGTCPAPLGVSWTFMGQNASFEFEWQPMCDGATTLRPFLIAVSMCVAAFIIAGLRGAGGKA